MLKPSQPTLSSGFVFNFKPLNNIFSQKAPSKILQTLTVQAEEEDPLDAYMSSIQADVVEQELFTKSVDEKM